MNICVYGASSNALAPEYFQAAEALGAAMAEGGHTLVFGGGQTGLMGAVARGAQSRGGSIIGISPKFFDRPGVLIDSYTKFIYTDTMRERKALMEEYSDAIIMLPGGIGTYEEFFEMFTLKQLGRTNKPIAILNTRGYYSAMEAMLRHTADEGFMHHSNMDLYRICATPEEALDYVLTAERPELKEDSWMEYSPVGLTNNEE